MPPLHPLLPLRETVLLPGMITRLYLPRASDVAAIEFHLETHRPLLTAPQLDPLEEEPSPAGLTGVGCTATVLRAVRLGDGTMRVLIEGGARANVVGPRPDAEAGMAAVARPAAEVMKNPERCQMLAESLRAALRDFVSENTTQPAALTRLADIELTPARLADRVVSMLTLAHAQQQAYLIETVVDRRLEQVLLDLARERELQAITVAVHKKVQETLDKQQREYYLREQIRHLRTELGEIGEAYDEAAELELRLKTVGLPEAHLAEVLRELDRLRRMHPDAAEYTVTRTWLEWLVSLPWTKLSLDSDAGDLLKAAKVLDKDHYGLEKVKDRILEYLAVRQLNPSGKGPVLCFLGPPGVGKTSLGRSIAAALGRNFQRVSLGGVKDEAEIRGHRRTYVGALPGRIIHALKKAGTSNPVIVLDEIDKIGKDFRGDPSSALLEVLDPEQNHEFSDHYIDVPVDLSQVLFICTANLADPIPAALHDRLEIIELPGYTLEEKVHIAERHLVPRLRHDHGLEASQLQVSRGAIEQVIEGYTREAGVRNLERELATLHRKVARRFVEGRTRNLRLHSEDSVRKVLGPKRHFTELAERANVPGIAIGLAWTASGGDILFIEVSRYADKGTNLKLTGQLGGVMKESAEAALSILRARFADFGVSGDAFTDQIFHIHVPAGGIPKDGPSAGVTLLTALLSLLTGRPVRPSLAMTGEITLRGKVLPVGGVKEKVLAARRAGVTEVLLPSLNRDDLDDIPEVLRRQLQFHFVDTIDQVLALSFADRDTLVPNPAVSNPAVSNPAHPNPADPNPEGGASPPSSGH